MAQPDSNPYPPASADRDPSAAGSVEATAAWQQFEARLAQLERCYRNLFEDCSDPILITEPDGMVIDLNPRAVQFIGVNREDLIGKSLSSESMPAGLRGLLTLLPAARQQPEWQQSLETKLGVREISLTLAVRHIIYTGRPALQWLVHDRTEIQEMERARDEQIYMIVHDLRNPLSNIISSLELLKDSLRDPNMTPAPGALVNIALRSSRRISLLVESLMDMTRLEGGQFTLTTTTARLDTLIERAVDFVKPTADRKHIPLSIDLEAGLPPVLIDVNMIERVVVNLLDNACKFVLPGQAVTVSARRGKGNEVEISVRDEGPGIAPEDRARLFHKFSRGASAISGQAPGTGLGLAFCKLAVEIHGGKIRVESELGKGSTFTFSLPTETT
ncbi:MAG TPA: ATP-binding protein [Anaerolineae bacterium]|nr:ATP-binding protein [Anaerolineae bacterium]